MQWFTVGACAVLGLAVGSFLNVVIHRVPLRASVVRPRSHCPSCEHVLTAGENVPLISWVLLRGRCRGCGAHISLRYPAVEALCSLMFALVAWRFFDTPALPAYLLLTATLISVSFIDLEHLIVPNRIVFPVMGSSVVLLALAGAVDGEGGDFVRALLGGLAAGGGLLVVHLVSPRGMGMGDVKLSLLLGLYLGWLGWGQVALGMFLGFLIGSVVGVGLIVVGIKGRKEFVPFAPFLASGTMLGILWGDPILRWYSHL